MKTLQEKISYTATVQTTQVATTLVETGQAKSRALMFHDDGFRVIESDQNGFIHVVRGYIARQKPRAYSLILDASFTSDQREQTPCLLCATVRDDGKARTMQTPYTRSAEGVELQDERMVPLDEEFLRYYENPLVFSEFALALGGEVAAIAKQPLQPYLDFFVVQS
ncbi:hypothetical protein [Pseudomonas amygdali]|uniref:Uncharacterized protein n=2 Tax=Pseudomonas amygdali pv. lachrymans TaxID=53707 RepID=A0ABR5KRL5_PSEAV|nr:hypothetical protein [Pseudomonas amygdali]AXH60030.1 hypothetical protein PLA107_032915 [Pseudomonas amygdali pv. lachrymans str. M301315]KPC17433.1 Uncharacterized protein AC499_0635 [Pseudomonas amygdali pv. lachrymans]